MAASALPLGLRSDWFLKVEREREREKFRLAKKEKSFSSSVICGAIHTKALGNAASFELEKQIVPDWCEHGFSAPTRAKLEVCQTLNESTGGERSSSNQKKFDRAGNLRVCLNRRRQGI